MRPMASKLGTDSSLHYGHAATTPLGKPMDTLRAASGDTVVAWSAPVPREASMIT